MVSNLPEIRFDMKFFRDRLLSTLPKTVTFDMEQFRDRLLSTLPKTVTFDMEQFRDRLKKYQTREVALWALSIGTSIGSLLLARTLYNYHQRRRNSITSNDHDNRSNNSDHTKNDGHNPSSSKDTVAKGDDRKLFLTIRSARSQLVSADVWRQFEEAAYQIRNDNTTAKPLTNGDKLLLYALYKQIVDGNAPNKMIHSKSNWNIMAERAKYDAWTRMRDIPIPDAINHYITAVEHFCESSANSRSVVRDQNQNDIDGGDDDTVTSYSESRDVMETIFAPATQSRPEVDNGGIVDYYNDDDENDVRNGGLDNGHTISLEIQLLHAVGRNCYESVQKILNQIDGAVGVVNVNYVDETGQTALHLAADKGNIEIVQLLINAGGNVHATDNDGISILQAAVIAGHVTTCQLLLEKYNTNPDQPDYDGDTPRSCCNDDLENIDMIQLFSRY